ncbi:MAG: putative porin [Bacteroidia bacterium]|nr:putative porin [Bacteroidia bacterium]
MFIALTAADVRAQAAADASQDPGVKLPRQTLRYDGIWSQGDSVRHSLEGLSYWDEADAWSGFTWRLGMVGKALLNHRYGLSGVYLPTVYFRNPATLYPDPYVLDPALNLPCFDARTPYALVEFDQASRQSQFFSFTFTQNVRRWWNATAYYKRRSAVGAYPDALTDHYNIGFSQRFAVRRFVAVLGAAFNQLKDGQNGGVFQDGTVPFEFLFDKQAQRMRLRGASLHRRVRALYAAARFDLVRDSLKTFALGADLRIGDMLYRYDDPVLYTPQELNNSPFHPYGGTTATVRFDDAWNLSDTGLRIGISAGRQTDPFVFDAKVFALVERRLFAGDIDARQLKTGLNAQTTLRRAGRTADFALNAEAQYAVNNLFAAEIRLSGALEAGFFAQNHVLIDSVEHWRRETARAKRAPFVPDTHRIRRLPVRLTARGEAASQNPTFMATYWRGDHRDPTLGLFNETPALLRAALEYTGKPAVKRRMPFDPNRASVEAFASRWSSPVYFNAWAQTRQAPRGEGVTRAGVVLSFRQRWRRLYVSGEATWQTVVASSAALKAYARSLPPVFGKLSVYFNGPVPRVPLILRAGVDWTFFTAYTGFHFHPAYQIFYPRAQVNLPAYSTFDLYLHAQIKTVRFYLKLHHLNEGLFVPGYYLVTHYPMLERTFAFGVKWHFYD